jgi:hypothetical protein
MTSPRTLTLSDAAEVCGTTKKALERRAERGTLRVSRRGGVRVVEVPELIRVGLLGADADVQRPSVEGPMARPLAALARRVAEADADMADLRSTLAATEVALGRAREEARTLRTRLARVSATTGPDVLAETA